MKVIYSVGATLGSGGVGVHAGEAVKQLAKAGVLSKVICAGSNYSGSDFATVNRFTVSIPVEAPWRIPGHRYFYPNWLKDGIFDVTSLVFVYRNTNHLLHSWNGHCLWAARKARRLGYKTVIERNSLYPLEQEALLKTEYKKFGFDYTPTHPISLRRTVKELQETNFIATPSSLVYQSLINAGIPKSRIWKPNPLGVDFSSFAKGQKLKAKGHRNFVFVGGDPIRKGLYYLLEAWDKIQKSQKLKAKSQKLFLLGLPSHTFDSHPFNKFKGLKDVVDVGWANSRDYYAQSSVFVMPSIEDGWGLVVTEAMAAGLPVIISENVGAKDAVEDGKTGFVVKAADSDALAEKMSFFLENPDKAISMGQDAQQLVKSLTWDRYGAQLLRNYESS